MHKLEYLILNHLFRDELSLHIHNCGKIFGGGWGRFSDLVTLKRRTKINDLTIQLREGSRCLIGFPLTFPKLLRA
jgi:hypothetical protein